MGKGCQSSERLPTAGQALIAPDVQGFHYSSGSLAIFAAMRRASSLLSSLEGQNCSVFQAALTGGKYNSATFRVFIVKNSARYETGSLYHRRSGALR
jgi:hypothetical protein